ncbi:hypothetical protein O6H91_10G083600 [Diphasiastrum complanatum]|uniref:Uncharacterized protein n=1 Tax=Diphasiastrum complanatum TaxID=34168 RepID=A0ACC2CJ35_DIPCM|nr:hypothetical protein O6H91_10G083600 [Diphasiastrum complanatum]
MSHSSGSISLEVDTTPWGGQGRLVPTSHGAVSVIVCGDLDKPALLTYPDLALDCVSSFQGLFSFPETSSFLLHNFCVYHIDIPGHEIGAAAISSTERLLSVEDLADQVEDICRLQNVMCMGVTAGAYILCLFALKYQERVSGLILVSPICRSPSWTEWIQNKAMMNVLYFWGMCEYVQKKLLNRYFGETCRNSYANTLFEYSRVLNERQGINVMRFLKAINHRSDLTARLRKLERRTLICVGEDSPFYHESIHFSNNLSPRYISLVEVQGCGSLVIEEQPDYMWKSMESFLMEHGFQRPVLLPRKSFSASNLLSPPCLQAQLFSLESYGLKLKPIKTRMLVV